MSSSNSSIESQSYLDPQNHALADQLSTLPPLETLTIPDLRKAIDQVSKHTPQPGVSVNSFMVPASYGEAVKCYLYKPEHVREDLPVVFHFHGGGWISGDVYVFDYFIRDIVLRTGFAVVFPEYQRSPEKTFPSQHEQCFSAVKYVASQGRQLGVKTDKFVIIGDSAGGQLSTAVAILAQERKLSTPIVHEILVCPLIDSTSTDSTYSEKKFFSGPFLTVGFIREAIRDNIPKESDRESILASPLKMSKTQAATMPPTTVIVSSVDPLRSEGEAYARLLQGAGVDCALIRAEGQLHDSPILVATQGSATVQAILGMIGAQLKRALVEEVAPPVG